MAVRRSQKPDGGAIPFAFWNDRRVRKLTPMERLVAIYLLAGPQNTQIGIFQVDIDKAAQDLQMAPVAFQTAMVNTCGVMEWKVDRSMRCPWIVFFPRWCRANEVSGPAQVRAMLEIIKPFEESSPLLVKEWKEALCLKAPRLISLIMGGKCESKGRRIAKEPKSNIAESVPETTTQMAVEDLFGTVPTRRNKKEEAEVATTEVDAAKERGDKFQYPATFLALCRIYPKQGDKTRAYQVYTKMRPSPTVQEVIRRSIIANTMSGRWKDPKFIPSFANYLARRQFENYENNPELQQAYLTHVKMQAIRDDDNPHAPVRLDDQDQFEIESLVRSRMEALHDLHGEFPDDVLTESAISAGRQLGLDAIDRLFIRLRAGFAEFIDATGEDPDAIRRIIAEWGQQATGT